MKQTLGFTLFRICMAVTLVFIISSGEALAAQQLTILTRQQGEVVLTLSKTSAGPGEPITVTVTNLTSLTVATLNHKSLCSIFQIQSEDTGEEVLECGWAEPTEVEAIPPGGSESLTFNGESPVPDPGILDPGVYRVQFTYKLVEKPEDILNQDIPWQTASSPSLEIVSPIPVAVAPPAESLTIQGPFVSEQVTPFVFTGDLRDLPKVAPISSNKPANSELTQALFSAPIITFDGLFNPPGFGLVPPDTNGAAGPSHYIQTVNIQFAIYDKLGNILVGPSNTNTLWTGFGGPCETENDGDPTALYDRLADRWIISQFVAFTNQCIAVSQTSDPVTGGWFLYDFPTGGIVNDYPHFGVWPDAYYMGSNAFYPCCGSDAWAYDRTNMLSGNPATFVRFHDPGAFMLPSDLDGTTLPPSGTPNVFARLVDGAQFGGLDRLELRQFHVDFAVPADSTFTPLPDLPVAPFDRDLCGFGLIGACIPQLGTTQRLQSLTAWLMNRLQYRNFGTHEILMVNHTVDMDGTDHAGIRWYELRRIAGIWSIFQQGTYAPDADHRWMGSIAMDKDGNIALGYSVSGGTLFPSIRYAGRLASDPLGTLPQGEFELLAGGGSQTTGFNRWGDYSAMTVDPVDDCTFWYTTEYYQVTSAASWRTHIGAFRFPSCEGVELSITKSDTPDPVTPGGTLTYSLTVTNSGPGDATDVVVTDTLPPGVTFVSATPSQGSCNEMGGVVTCDLGDLANGASATGTIVVTVDSAATCESSLTNTAVVASNESDPNLADNSASADTTITCAVGLNIRPEVFPNRIRLSGGPRLVHVAILSSPSLDAPNDVDRTSLTFGHSGDENSLHRRGRDCWRNDVNNDGLLDLVCNFVIRKTGFLPSDTIGILKGMLLDGTSFEAQDSVVIIE